MKEQPKRFDDSQNREIKKQILALDPEKDAALDKKWFAFTRKDYSVVFFLSLIIMAFKVHVYITFAREMDHSFHHIGSPEKFEIYGVLFMLIFLISFCICITVPVVLILRALLTAQLKKKIRKLEKLTK
ncbi:hypothetical protein [Bartonella acomydis]